MQFSKKTIKNCIFSRYRKKYQIELSYCGLTVVAIDFNLSARELQDHVDNISLREPPICCYTEKVTGLLKWVTF